MMIFNQGSSTLDDKDIFDASHQKGQNVVTPDNGSSSYNGFGFNFCGVMESLPSFCGESLPVSVTDDDGMEASEKLNSVTDSRNDCLQSQPAATEPADPMNESSYISVHLIKPIGIRFQENYSNHGGVFVADINNKFSAAADGTINRGYQLVAVGEKKVSGMNFDEAVMQPIVDNVDAEVMLVFFKGSAECLYHPSSGASDEWLNNFIAMNAIKQNMKNVEIEDDDSGIEIVANATASDAACEDEVTYDAPEENVVVEEAETAEKVETAEGAETAKDGLDIDEPQPADDELDLVEDLNFHDGPDDDFFSKIADLNTTTSFDWTPKKTPTQSIKPVEDLSKPHEENNMDINSWSFPDYSVIESSHDDTQEITQAAEIASLVSESVSVREANVASETETALGNDENKTETETEIENASIEQCAVSASDDVTTDAAKNEGDTDELLTDKSEEESGADYVENTDNCILPHSHASYSPSTGFALRTEEELPEISKDEVLIKVDATTISTRDCLERFRRDKNDKLKDDSWTPGHEIVGRVVRAGIRAKILLDRRVAALLPHGGGCSRYVRIHAKDLISLPETADCNEIVALLSTYLSAYQCLEYIKGESDMDLADPSSNSAAPEVTKEEEGQKKSPLSGSSLLITGGGSPVGLALIDIAKHAGATVYAVSHSSFEKDIREMGVKEWYPLFKKKEWKTEWSGKMNLIIDTVGDYDNYPVFFDIMAVRGRFVRMNTTSCGKKYIPNLGEQVKVFSALKDYKGSRINNAAIDYDVFQSFNDDQELFTEDLAYLYHLQQMGKIEPRVFARAGFDDLQEEWEKIMEGGANGVVVVSPWKD